jgi:hypothetical protein
LGCSKSIGKGGRGRGMCHEGRARSSSPEGGPPGPPGPPGGKAVLTPSPPTMLPSRLFSRPRGRESVWQQRTRGGHGDALGHILYETTTDTGHRQHQKDPPLHKDGGHGLLVCQLHSGTKRWQRSQGVSCQGESEGSIVQVRHGCCPDGELGSPSKGRMGTKGGHQSNISQNDNPVSLRQRCIEVPAALSSVWQAEGLGK